MDPHSIPTVAGDSNAEMLANIEAMVANLNERRAQIQREEREAAEAQVAAERMQALQAKQEKERQNAEAESKAKELMQDEKAQEASRMLGRPVVFKACPPYEDTPQQKVKRLAEAAQKAQDDLNRAMRAVSSPKPPPIEQLPKAQSHTRSIFGKRS